MTVSGSKTIDAARPVEILRHARRLAAGAVVIGDAHQGIDHDLEPVLVVLL
jgi:hypothetical protein